MAEHLAVDTLNTSELSSFFGRAVGDSPVRAQVVAARARGKRPVGEGMQTEAPLVAPEKRRRVIALSRIELSGILGLSVRKFCESARALCGVHSSREKSEKP